MADSQGDAYVRRDVFEARMDRMEMLLEKTVIEIKSYVDKSTSETKSYVEKALGEIRTEIAEVRNDVKVLTARVQAVENTLSWWIALFAALIAMIAFFTPIVEYIRKRLKPPFTLEDIKAIVRAEIANQSGGVE